MEKTFLVTCELGYEDQTVSDLNQLPGVDASRLAGAYDIIAKVNAESTESLTKVIRIGDKETKQSSVNTDIRFNPQFDVRDDGGDGLFGEKPKPMVNEAEKSFSSVSLATISTC